MRQIELTGIEKRFKVYERPEGKWRTLRGAFSRRVRTVEALRGISFGISEGELTGYIGPNGAGKSTSVKIMGGILTPDGGSCQILGRTPWKDRRAHVAHIGVVFGQRSQLWWDVPVMDSFDLLRDIYTIPQGQYRRRRDELIGALSIEDLLNTPVRQLSLGQRMRCELTAALLHRPRILFLDEPTIGLDAVSKLALRAFLKEENERHSTTMVLTTHDMDDVEALCGRIMVIGHGSLLFDGTLPALNRRYAPHARLTVELPEGPGVPPLSLRGLVGMEQEGARLTITYDPEALPTHELIGALSARHGLAGLQMSRPSIDEMIAAMYRDLAL